MPNINSFVVSNDKVATILKELSSYKTINGESVVSVSSYDESHSLITISEINGTILLCLFHAGIRQGMNVMEEIIKKPVNY